MTRPILTHAGIYVRDMEKMASFYKDVMGLVESDRGHGVSMPTGLIFLTADPTKHHQLVLAAGRGADAPSTINQISFKVGGLDELREMHRRVRDFGVTRLRGISHGNAWSVYFEDPEQNTVELYLDTPWYVSQPHADPLDLELSNEEIYRRTEARCREDGQFMPVEKWEAKMREALG